MRSYPVDHWWYRGEITEIEVEVAIGWSGTTQIELIGQTNDAVSMYLDYLATSPAGGLQHLGYRCADYDRAVAEGRTAGYTVLMNGLVGETRFAYLEPPDGSHAPVVKVSVGSEASARLHADKAATARAWEGNAPITELP